MHSSFGNLFRIAHPILLLTTLLHLIGNELLVLLQAALNVQLETHDVVEHTLDLGVQLFAEGVGLEDKLLIPAPQR